MADDDEEGSEEEEEEAAAAAVGRGRRASPIAHGVRRAPMGAAQAAAGCEPAVATFVNYMHFHNYNERYPFSMHSLTLPVFIRQSLQITLTQTCCDGGPSDVQNVQVTEHRVGLY